MLGTSDPLYPRKSFTTSPHHTTCMHALTCPHPHPLLASYVCVGMGREPYAAKMGPRQFLFGSCSTLKSWNLSNIFHVSSFFQESHEVTRGAGQNEFLALCSQVQFHSFIFFSENCESNYFFFVFCLKCNNCMDTNEKVSISNKTNKGLQIRVAKRT